MLFPLATHTLTHHSPLLVVLVLPFQRRCKKEEGATNQVLWCLAFFLILFLPSLRASTPPKEAMLPRDFPVERRVSDPASSDRFAVLVRFHACVDPCSGTGSCCCAAAATMHKPVCFIQVLGKRAPPYASRAVRARSCS